ncbi:MAG: DUF4974 domain-containing protein [Bacteroidetes bacterium]|nr:MAG: DUF4974 domain-containing protein [Bacteroidota bacterium]
MAFKQNQGWKQWSNPSKTNNDSSFHQKLWNLTESYGNDFQPDVERGWKRFRNRIHPQTRRTRLLRFWTKAAAAVILLTAGLLVAQNMLDTPAPLVVVETTQNMVKEVTLPDGTIVSVNENSRFSFPETFESDRREVRLNGEAFFKVAKNPERPFRIESDFGKVEVLGTAFNYRARPGENIEEVFVKEGRVAFGAKTDQNTVELTRDQIGRLYKTTLKVEILPAENDNALAWKTRELEFVKSPLSEILNQLEKHKGLSFRVKDPDILDCHFTLSCPIQNTTQSLRLLETMANNDLRFKKTGPKTYEVSGTPCR